MSEIVKENDQDLPLGNPYIYGWQKKENIIKVEKLEEYRVE